MSTTYSNIFPVRELQRKNLSTRGTIYFFYARVVDIVLDASHPDFGPYGGPLSIGGIRFKVLDTNMEEIPGILPFAYVGNPNYKNYPLKEEIVEIVKSPSEDMNLAPQASKNYYYPLVNIWNQPNHNAFPDQFRKPGQPADLGPDAIELPEIGLLQPFTGNMSYEGRHGNTLRLFGYKQKTNPYHDDSNNGKPMIILRNGQGLPKNPVSHTVLEDINADAASMYMTSDHSVRLLQAETKRLAYFPSEIPLEAPAFRGKQIQMNSDRIFINAKTEHVLLSAAVSVGINAVRSVNVDARKYVCLDARRIYLGEKAKWEEEPAVLCNRLKRWLEMLLDLLEEVGNLLQTNPPSVITWTSPIGMDLEGFWTDEDGNEVKVITPLPSITLQIPIGEPAAYAAGVAQVAGVAALRAILPVICSIKVWIEP